MLIVDLICKNIFNEILIDIDMDINIQRNKEQRKRRTCTSVIANTLKPVNHCICVSPLIHTHSLSYVLICRI